MGDVADLEQLLLSFAVAAETVRPETLGISAEAGPALTVRVTVGFVQESFKKNAVPLVCLAARWVLLEDCVAAPIRCTVSVSTSKPLTCRTVRASETSWSTTLGTSAWALLAGSGSGQHDRGEDPAAPMSLLLALRGWTPDASASRCRQSG